MRDNDKGDAPNNVDASPLAKHETLVCLVKHRLLGSNSAMPPCPVMFGKALTEALNFHKPDDVTYARPR